MGHLYLAVLSLAAVLVTCLEARSLPANHIQARDVAGKELRDLSYKLWQKFHKRGVRDLDIRQTQQQQQEEQTNQVEQGSLSTCDKISSKVIKIKNLILEIWDDYILKSLNREPQFRQLAVELVPTIKAVLENVPDEHITYRVCAFASATTIEELADAMTVDPQEVYGALSIMHLYSQFIDIEDDLVPLLEDFLSMGHDVWLAMKNAGVQDPEGRDIIPTLGRYFELKEMEDLISEIKDTYDDTFSKLAKMISKLDRVTISKDQIISHVFPPGLAAALTESNTLREFADDLNIGKRDAVQIDRILTVYATAPEEAIQIEILLMDIIKLLVYDTKLLDIMRSTEPFHF